MPDSLNQSVILKPGKKKSDTPADYRPTSLTRCNNKILAKIISNRSAKILPNVIPSDQSGFVKIRHLQTNIRAFSLMQHTKRNSIKMPVVTVNTEKAFDRVEWNFLFIILEVLKMPKDIINLLKTLNSAPQVNIYIMQHYHHPFSLLEERDMVAHYPLYYSPHMLIRQDKDLSGVSVNNKEYKLNLFVDDLVLYPNITHQYPNY